MQPRRLHLVQARLGQKVQGYRQMATDAQWLRPEILRPRSHRLSVSGNDRKKTSNVAPEQCAAPAIRTCDKAAPHARKPGSPTENAPGFHARRGSHANWSRLVRWPRPTPAAPVPAPVEGEAPAPAAKEPAAPIAPPAPTTFTIGVTDLCFNATNAIFGRQLKTTDGHIVSLAYWQEKESVSNDELPYFDNK